ncbi:MAG: serine protease, partial [Ginsengibacter sp.]
YLMEKEVIGAVGFAVGYKNDNISSGLALSLFVDKKIIIENVPKTIKYLGITGIPTDIKEVGEIKHNLTDEILTPDEDLPMRMGGSISVKNPKEFGTRGLLLTKDKKQFLLTCYHVLLMEFFPNKTLYEGLPSRLAEYPSSMTMPLVESNTGSIVYGCYDSNNDFAIVKVDNANALVNGISSRRFKGFYDSNTLPSLLNKNVITAGAVTNMKQGKVLDTNGKVILTNTGRRFENVVVTEKISKPGDSGAPVIDENNKVVGIIIASDEFFRSYILPVHNLLILNSYRLN